MNPFIVEKIDPNSIPDPHWAMANRLSEGIVTLMNREVEVMIANMDDPEQRERSSPMQLLAGQLLALHALMQTLPDSAPDTLKTLAALVAASLRVIGGPTSRMQQQEMPSDFPMPAGRPS